MRRRGRESAEEESAGTTDVELTRTICSASDPTETCEKVSSEFGVGRNGDGWV